MRHLLIAATSSPPPPPCSPPATRHADIMMREVRGVRTRMPRYDERAQHLGLTVREVGQAVRSARSKVGRRLWERRQKEAEHAH